MFYTFLGILSSVIFFIGDIPYFLDSLKKKTQPHRITWGIVFLINTIGFANQHASGARNSLWLFGAAVLATGSIFVVSLFNGVGGKAKLDIVSLAIALAGVAVWAISNDPTVSIIANLIAGVVGVYPTIVKSRHSPESETVSAYLFGSISTLLAAISVGELNIKLLVLPLSGFLIQAYLVYLIKLRPKRTNIK